MRAASHSISSTPSERLNPDPMRKLLVTLPLVMAAGCATSPAVLCDHFEVGLAVMAQPPAEAQALLAELRTALPNAVDERRDHVAWLQSAGGDLYLCTYERRPVVTGTCGATVHHYVRTATGYEGGHVSISACH